MLDGGEPDVSSLTREELLEHAIGLRTVLNVAEAVHHARDLRDFAERAVDAVTRFTKFPSVGLFRLDRPRDQVVCLAIRGFGPEVEAATRTLPLSGSLTGIAVREKRIATSHAVPTDARVEGGARAAMANEGYSGAACVPLLHRDEVIGTLNLIYRRAHDPSAQEQRTLLAIGHTIAAEMQDRLAADARRELEEQARRGRHLESLGVLAGGVAHDFNNLLVAILGAVILARGELAGGDTTSVSERLSDVEKACLRARDIVRQLLTFARGGAPVPTPTEDVGAVVRDAAEFALHGAGVRLATRVAEALPPLEVDAPQLAQIAQNLVMNGAQASQPGSEVRLSLDVRASEDALDLVLCVEDDGAGMTDETRSRIFEPYFTTRQQGTGLGLATVHSIVRRHGGRIDVESAPGKGSRFTVVIPVRRAPNASRATMRAGDISGTRVLVVDDEARVRATAVAMLRRIGADAEMVADGYEAAAAVENARARGGPFRVVLLDLTLVRGPQGTEIWRTLRAIDPELRAIASSGYALDGAMANPDHHGFSAVLPKPYTLDALKAALASVLAQAAPSPPSDGGASDVARAGRARPKA